MIVIIVHVGRYKMQINSRKDKVLFLLDSALAEKLCEVT